MSEISNGKDIEIKKPQTERFEKMKPQTDITKKDADSFWLKEFKSQEESDGKEKYADIDQETQHKEYDDDGNLYRIDNKLLPDKTFTVKGYKYMTDSEGRIKSAGGELRLKGESSRSTMENVKKLPGQDYKQTDHQGHLIADRFDASARLENLVPMEKKLNQGDYAKLENKLADALKAGDNVDYKVDVKYGDNSNRPTEFRVSYSINGERNVTVFKNQSGGAT